MRIPANFISPTNLTPIGSGFISFSFILFIGLQSISAQNSWTQLRDFGGEERHSAVSFSINGKGYIGTGMHLPETHLNDFWEYEPSTDTWTKVSDLPVKKSFGIGFAINGKGYVLTGRDDSLFSVYEFNPITNSWTVKASFPGNNRTNASAFVIGSKAYVGLGSGNNSYYKDFWSFDPTTNKWTQIADLPGPERNQAAAFSIGPYGYIGCGFNGDPLRDFWRYDVASDSWTQMADFGGQARLQLVGFSIGEKGYFGLGNYGGPPPRAKDFWEYDPTKNSWQQMLDLPDDPITQSSAFVIDSTAYIGTGYQNSESRVIWGFKPDSEINVGVPVAQQMNSFQLTIAPNPTSGMLWLNSENSFGELMIEIYDIRGRLVHTQQTMGNSRLKLELKLETGVYFMAVSNETREKSITKKFIIQ